MSELFRGIFLKMKITCMLWNSSLMIVNLRSSLSARMWWSSWQQDTILSNWKACLNTLGGFLDIKFTACRGTLHWWYWNFRRSPSARMWCNSWQDDTYNTFRMKNGAWMLYREFLWQCALMEATFKLYKYSVIDSSRTFEAAEIFQWKTERASSLSC